MRVVLDTNVLARATKYATGPARELGQRKNTRPQRSGLIYPPLVCGRWDAVEKPAS